MKRDRAALFREHGNVVRIPQGEDLPLVDLLAITDIDDRADDDVVGLELLFLLVDDLDRARLVQHDVGTVGRLHHPEAVVTHRAGAADEDFGFLEATAGHAADVEGPHRQLGAGLADRLGGDDADGVADLGELVRGQIDAIRLGVDAVLARRGQGGHDLDPLDAGILDLAGGLLGDQVAGTREQIGRIERVGDVVGRAPADDPLTQGDDLIITFVDRLLPHAFPSAAILLPDDDVHGDVAQLAGEIAGVGRLEGGVGKALAGAVGRDEVLEHREPLAERREDRALDDFARGFRHEAAGAAQLADLLAVAAGARVHHDVHGVDLVLALVRLELGEDLLGDAVGGGGPKVDDLVLPLALGDDALAELALDLGDLLARFGDDVLLRLRDDHVVDADGDAGLEGGLEAELLQLVERLDRRDVARRLVGVEDQVAELGLRDREVHEAEAGRPDLVEDHAADGGPEDLAVLVAVDRVAPVVGIRNVDPVVLAQRAVEFGVKHLLQAGEQRHALVSWRASCAARS